LDYMLVPKQVYERLGNIKESSICFSRLQILSNVTSKFQTDIYVIIRHCYLM